VVSTHLKNISQIGNLPQLGLKIKNIWVATTQINTWFSESSLGHNTSTLCGKEAPVITVKLGSWRLMCSFWKNPNEASGRKPEMTKSAVEDLFFCNKVDKAYKGRDCRRLTISVFEKSCLIQKHCKQVKWCRCFSENGIRTPLSWWLNQPIWKICLLRQIGSWNRHKSGWK